MFDWEPRFWAKTERRGACLEWTASRTSDGYGRFWLDGRFVLAPRVAWLIEHGAWPEHHALHTCDNPPCVLIEHLFDGTMRDNIADSIAKGRFTRHQGDVHSACPERRARGHRVAGSRLTDDQILAIRVRRLAGEPRVSLAAEFSVSERTIWQIATGRTWRHL